MRAYRMAVTAAVGAAALAFGVSAAFASGPVAVDQGPNWNSTTREQFYSQDQGSQIMPLTWFEALKQPNGKPFVGDSLGRYGYLPNPASPTPGLPVGFTVDGSGAGTMVGMTCAACHTRQIVSGGVSYRIDGGPGIVDFQSFLQDLDVAMDHVVHETATFDTFAVAVLGPSPSPAAKATLKSAVDLWFLRYDTLIAGALPRKAWGPERLDAVSMIFNRLTGLDLGASTSHLIPSNIQKATAPVRYPFLWNAAIQDHTQWPGFAVNGSPFFSLTRNLGEVFGVFATFAPVPHWYGTDYLTVNSANFPGLVKLGTLMRDIGPPRWPTGWALNKALAAKGQAVFNRATADGGCVACHGIRPGTTRFYDHKTWATPIVNVGTDTREHAVLTWTAKTGVLNGAYTIADPTPLKPVDASINILGMSVIGSIEQYCVLNAFFCGGNLGSPQTESAGSGDDTPAATLRAITAASQKIFQLQAPDAYESRVLQGIWAAAPYLHNGSVPTLAQLLTPPAERIRDFAVGPNYDRTNVGLAQVQTKFDYTYHATGCDDRNSGNSNCGHAYGTDLSGADKAALLEYLKSL